MSRLEYQPIGVIHSPFKEPAGMPIQPLGAQGVGGRVEATAAYEEGLRDLSDFSHIILLYHFHRSRGYRLRVGIVRLPDCPQRIPGELACIGRFIAVKPLTTPIQHQCAPVSPRRRA
jgi:tRNA (Thr-GGU) A37 N-methylase